LYSIIISYLHVCTWVPWVHVRAEMPRRRCPGPSSSTAAGLRQQRHNIHSPDHWAETHNTGTGTVTGTVADWSRKICASTWQINFCSVFRLLLSCPNFFSHGLFFFPSHHINTHQTLAPCPPSNTITCSRAHNNSVKGTTFLCSLHIWKFFAFLCHTSRHEPPPTVTTGRDPRSANFEPDFFSLPAALD
jgi:hypothetical protein